MDSYRIPTGNGASEYVEKRSRFLGLVQPVSSEDEAREIIAACKKQYHDARHNCWCYLLRDGTEPLLRRRRAAGHGRHPRCWRCFAAQA